MELSTLVIEQSGDVTSYIQMSHVREIRFDDEYLDLTVVYASGDEEAYTADAADDAEDRIKDPIFIEDDTYHKTRKFFRQFNGV